LGIDLDQRIVYYIDQQRRLVGLDLEARVARPYVDEVRLAEVGPDGSAYAVDSGGRVIRVSRRASTVFPARFETPPSPTPSASHGTLFGTLNGQMVAVTGDSVPALRLLSLEQSGDPVPLAGGVVAATWWGELVAAASGDGVLLLSPNDPARTSRISLPGQVVSLAFSPSGHRLYVLTAEATVHAFDRFTRDRRSTLELPGPARALRVDRTGRWMLARPEIGDSVWVVDLATSRVIASIPTAWGASLPLVAGAATLLAADGDDVVSWHLETIPVGATARVPGSAKDQWLAVSWVPPHRAPTAVAAAESASAVQDSALLAALPRPVSELAIYLQVSSSQNPEWADQLAAQLADSGFPAQVWRPSAPEESYRVVIGPYGSRDEAQEVGRLLRRPFFLVGRAPSP
jgi:hypothetical protein